MTRWEQFKDMMLALSPLLILLVILLVAAGIAYVIEKGCLP